MTDQEKANVIRAAQAAGQLLTFHGVQMGVTPVTLSSSMLEGVNDLNFWLLQPFNTSTRTQVWHRSYDRVEAH